jgi:hypothetical protein
MWRPRRMPGTELKLRQGLGSLEQKQWGEASSNLVNRYCVWSQGKLRLLVYKVKWKILDGMEDQDKFEAEINCAGKEEDREREK